jgi:hypothetical protein
MFALIVFGAILLAVAVFVAIGLWHKRPASAIWDKDRVETWETQAKVEAADIPAMLAAQNEARAARGLSPLTETEVRARVAAEQRRRYEEADREMVARGR